MKKMKWLLMVFLTVCFLACETDVILCTTTHPHQSQLNITFDWRGVPQKSIPDSMLVFAERLVNRWDCGYAINTKDYHVTNLFNPIIKPEPPAPDEEETDEETPDEEEIVEGTFEEDEAKKKAPEEGEAPTDEDPSEESESEPMSDEEEPTIEEDLPPLTHATIDVKSGQYIVMTFNRDTLEFNYEGLDAYVNDHSDTTSMDQIHIDYKAYRKNDERLKFFSSSWVDFNPYANYVQSNALPFFYNVSPLFKVNEGEVRDVQLSPVSLLQHITVNFDVQKIMDEEHRFVIDSIIAEISGVPHRFYIVKNELDVSKTYKMMLEPTRYTRGSAVVDNFQNTQLHFSSSFYAPGIVPAQSSTISMGPGILQIKIFLHAFNSDLKLQPVNAKMNLYNTLSAEPLIRMNEEGTAGTIIGTERAINIKTFLRIDGRSILTNDEEGTGDKWQQCEEGIIIDV